MGQGDLPDECPAPEAAGSDRGDGPGADPAADLADHACEWVEPASTEYRGHTVWELPPNGQGYAVLQMLNIL